MTKQQYFTVDGNWDFKMIRPFKVYPVANGNLDFDQFVLDFLIKERQSVIKTASKLAVEGELWLAKMLFFKANQISELIDRVMAGGVDGKDVTLDVAAFILTKKKTC